MCCSDEFAEWEEFFCVPGTHYWKQRPPLADLEDAVWLRSCYDHDEVMEALPNE